MAKKRVYEYAKEKNVSSKDVITKAKELGIEYQTHMSSMEDNQVEKLNNAFASNKTNQQAVQKKRIMLIQLGISRTIREIIL